MRRLLVVMILLAACAPVNVVESPPLPLAPCPEGQIPAGSTCCLDADDSGVCDVDEIVLEEPDEILQEEPEEEPVVNPIYSFSLRLKDGAPPEKIIPGEPFKISAVVESQSNVPLEGGYVQVIYANPKVFGLTSLKDFRRDITGTLEPGSSTTVTVPLTMDEDFDESSAINWEVKFCYTIVEPHERCIVTTKLVSIR